MKIRNLLAGGIAPVLFLVLLGSPAAMAADEGGMWHTIRNGTDGSWLQFGDIRSQAGRPGDFFDVSISGNIATGELHVVGTTYDGKLWHTIRDVNGNWLQFGDVTAQAGSPGPFGGVATALIQGNLHVVGQTAGGGLWHTIRDVNGNWLQFGDVTAQAGSPGDFQTVSISGNDATGELQVVAQTYPDRKLWHTIRDVNGNWLQFGDVTAQAGRPGDFTDVATALIRGNLHVVGRTHQDGKLWHTIRDVNGNWLQFGDVTAQAGRPGDFGAVSISGNDATGELHVAASTYQDGKLWHTIRDVNGNWLQFGDVTTWAGNPGLCGVGQVGIALIEGNLHVVIVTPYCIP